MPAEFLSKMITYFSQYFSPTGKRDPIWYSDSWMQITLYDLSKVMYVDIFITYISLKL